jgi:hypothetical protein
LQPMRSRKWRPASSVRTSSDCKASRAMLSSRNAWRIGTIRTAQRLPEPSTRPSHSVSIRPQGLSGLTSPSRVANLTTPFQVSLVRGKLIRDGATPPILRFRLCCLVWALLLLRTQHVANRFGGWRLLLFFNTEEVYGITADASSSNPFYAAYWFIRTGNGAAGDAVPYSSCLGYDSSGYTSNGSGGLPREMLITARKAAERPTGMTYTFCKYPDCKRG